MAEIQITSSGVMYRNPYPGHRAINAFLPCVHPITANEWICAFRYGSAFYSPDGMVHLLRTTDAGASWVHEGSAWDNGRDLRPYAYTGAFLTALGGSSFLLTNLRIDHSDRSMMFTNAATGGMMNVEIVWQRSSDAGRSWTAPMPVSTPPALAEQAVLTPSTGIIELAGGDWWLPLETWKHYDDRGPLQLRTVSIRSRDQGQTWEDEPTAVADGRAQGISYSHGRFIRRRDGSLFALLWTGDATMTKNLDLHHISSDTAARTFTSPQPTGLQGQTSWAAELDGGLMLAAYVKRGGDRPGIFVVPSTDGGRSWNVTDEVTIWDAYGKESLGVARTTSYPSSHDAIAFGRPQTVALNSHEALVSFWCTQSSDTHIRLCRLKVT